MNSLKRKQIFIASTLAIAAGCASTLTPPLWRHDFPSRQAFASAVDSRGNTFLQAVAGTSDTLIRSLDTEGHIRWEQSVAGTTDTDCHRNPVLVSDPAGVTLISATGEWVHRLSADTGTLRWSVRLDSLGDGNCASLRTAPTWTGAPTYVARQSATGLEIKAIDARGSITWSASVPAPGGANPDPFELANNGEGIAVVSSTINATHINRYRMDGTPQDSHEFAHVTTQYPPPVRSSGHVVQLFGGHGWERINVTTMDRKTLAINTLDDCDISSGLKTVCFGYKLAGGSAPGLMVINAAGQVESTRPLTLPVGTYNGLQQSADGFVAIRTEHQAVVPLPLLLPPQNQVTRQQHVSVIDPQGNVVNTINLKSTRYSETDCSKVSGMFSCVGGVVNQDTFGDNLLDWAIRDQRVYGFGYAGGDHHPFAAAWKVGH